MKNEFPWKRITTIFPTGNTGTLTNYYTADSSYIYAKTGSLSGVIALSGYIVTKKNRQLIFSVLDEQPPDYGQGCQARSGEIFAIHQG